MVVLLGVVEDPTVGYPTTFQTNKIGGSPDVDLEIQQILGDIRCPVCGNLQSHIVQIYCPLADSPYHRVIYIYACINKSCWNKSESWKVLRRQVLDPHFKSSSPQSEPHTSADAWGVGQDDWGVEADDWGDESVLMATGSSDADDCGYVSNDDNIANNDSNSIEVVDNETALNEEALCPRGDATDSAADMMQQMSIDESEQYVIAEDATVQPDRDLLTNILQTDTEMLKFCQTNSAIFDSYFIGVTEEPSDDFVDLKYEQRLWNEYRSREGVDIDDLLSVGRGEAGGSDERYERASAKHGDATFYKFKKKVQLCPQQVLRYDWKGKALHINRKQQVVIPACESCGKNRVYELQLMPSLIPLLKCSHNSGATVEFGVVLVYTCEGSCWKDATSFTEEFIVVEEDPDAKLFQ